jgi:hypothetical protein
MSKIMFICCFVFLLIPCVAIAGPKTPCTVVATANANTLVQAPSYYQELFFTTPTDFSGCCDNATPPTTFWGPTTATIIVANSPQNPPPTAPVYMSLNTGTPTMVPISPQVLLSQGTTIITKAQFPNWFPLSTACATTIFTGVTVYSPGTPWVPASITVIWQ